MTEEYKIGTILKRKFKDFQKVEIIGHINDFVIIKDSNDQHFIQIDKINDFFVVIEPVLPHEIQAQLNNNLDDPNRHSLSGGMNNSDRAAKKNYEINTKKKAGA